MEVKWKVISQEDYDALEHKGPDVFYAVVVIAPWWRPFERRRNKKFLRQMEHDQTLGHLVAYSIYDAQQVRQDKLYNSAIEAQKLYSKEEQDGQS